MNQSKDSNISSSGTSLNSASGMQDSIMGTLMKFESAISGLTQTVEQTRHNIEHVVDLSMKSKDELKMIKDQIMPYVSTARQASQKVVTRVKANPRPVALVFAGLIGSLFLMSYFQNRSANVSDAHIH